MRLVAGLLAAGLVACATKPATTEPARATADVAKETLAHVERIRAIKPGADSAAAVRYNRQLEDAWKFFLAQPKAALPVLRRELGVEIMKPARNDFLLLDLGYFLYEKGEPGDKGLARSALFTIDPGAEILRWNWQEFFQFVHAVADDGDPRVLPLIDRAFLRGDLAFSAGTPPMKLDAAVACTFLYGAYGSAAEAHLKRQLGDRAVARRIMEVLIWIGSPASNAEVRAAMTATRDNEAFVRGATFLMKAGGPDGRRLILAINPRTLDAGSQDYYGKIKKSVEATNFTELRKPIARMPGDAWVAGDELRKRLAAMNKGDGIDRATSPAAFLNSELPRDLLIEELQRVRTRLFRRVSAESLAAAQRVNDTINALRYRQDAK